MAAENSLKSGTCIKCGSNAVYNDEGINKHNQRGIIAIGFMGGVQVTTYICSSCGYVEEFVEKRYIENGSLSESLSKHWGKT